MKKTKLTSYRLAVACLALAGANRVSADDLHVPADYTTIQAAVDAAVPGDTIHIASGVYAQQTLISNKDLTLIGQPGTILRAFHGMALSFPGHHRYYMGILGVLQAEVTVSGLTFEGERLGDSQSGDLAGICFFAASGRVIDCRFTGFRGSTLGSTPYCRGVEVSNPVSLGTGVVDIQVLRCTFADNVRSLNLLGDFPTPSQPTADLTVLRTTIAINDNTIVGSGPDATGRQFGIFISAGVGGEVKWNVITDHSCVDPTEEIPLSQGLNANDGVNWGTTNPLEVLQPLHLEGNIFRNNQIHMSLILADRSTVVNNSFEGTAPGYRPGGLAFSGKNVLVATNRFSEMETGIALLGDDPDFGTSVGIASSATLTANGFCNVATNYNFQPLATYTVQGTLACPWPTLDIQAVQLSWPYSYNGYSVGTASAVVGPWSTLEATPFLQDGQNAVVIPADSDQQSFRLMKR